MQQLPIALKLSTDKTFDNFVIGSNGLLVRQLHHLAAGHGENVMIMWGATGTGCTHLLHATCCLAFDNGLRASYLSLQEAALTPAVLDDLESLDVVCIDDIDVIAGQLTWEVALFHLYNRMQTQQKHLVIALHQTLAKMPLLLPDLHSRLQAGLSFQLQELTDSEKIAVLQQHAYERGLDLTQEVAEFLLKRCRRDLQTLLDVLLQLDSASLSQQRRLTIPFIRRVLALPTNFSYKKLN